MGSRLRVGQHDDTLFSTCNWLPVWESVRQHLSQPACYQPLGLGFMRKWRQLDEDSLVILSDREESLRS